MRREGVHRLGIHRHLYLVAERRRHQHHTHARERVHERDVAQAPDSEESSGDGDLPEAEWQRTVHSYTIDGRIDLVIPMQLKAHDETCGEERHRW